MDSAARATTVGWLLRLRLHLRPSRQVGTSSSNPGLGWWSWGAACLGRAGLGWASTMCYADHPMPCHGAVLRLCSALLLQVPGTFIHDDKKRVFVPVAESGEGRRGGAVKGQSGGWRPGEHGVPVSLVAGWGERGKEGPEGGDSTGAAPLPCRAPTTSKPSPTPTAAHCCWPSLARAQAARLISGAATPPTCAPCSPTHMCARRCVPVPLVPVPTPPRAPRRPCVHWR